MTISILLVDDEEADIIRFQRAARKAGVGRPIDVCRNGFDALRLLASHGNRRLPEKAYLLVSDLKMPVMMGTKLVARIRRELGLARLRVFILSSSDAAADAGNALLSGANGYIAKCESDSDFLGVVKWLDECCSRIDCGQASLQDMGAATRPSQVIAGPIEYAGP